MRIINLTQHNASDEQLAAGVFEPDNKRIVQGLLTFNAIPDSVDLLKVAQWLAKIAAASGADAAMIGGAPYLMRPLEHALRMVNVRPVYSFSVRESADHVMPDGTTKKVAIFRHSGWVGM